MVSVPEHRVQEKLDHPRILLQQLPNTIAEGNKAYNKANLTVTDDDFKRGDGSEIGAVEKSFERIFGRRILGSFATFVERGDGLVSVVALLHDAFEHKTGDKAIIRRWVDYLCLSALKAYEVAKKKVLNNVFFDGK